MKCPNCFGSILGVQFSKHDSTESIIRQRLCKHCNHRFWTCEAPIPRAAFRWEGKDIRRTPDFQKVKFTA